MSTPGRDVADLVARWWLAGGLTALVALLLPWTADVATTVAVVSTGTALGPAAPLAAVVTLVAAARLAAARPAGWWSSRLVVLGCAALLVWSSSRALAEPSDAALDVGPWLVAAAVLQLLAGVASSVGETPDGRTT